MREAHRFYGPYGLYAHEPLPDCGRAALGYDWAENMTSPSDADW